MENVQGGQKPVTTVAYATTLVSQICRFQRKNKMDL